MGYLVKIPFKPFLLTIASFPLFSFVFCVVWSLSYNFKDTTSTHCLVSNYLPSISTAVGTFYPQKYVWRMGIALHSTPRFLVCFMYYKHFSNMLFQKTIWKHMTFGIFFFQNAEILSLIGLSYVSSYENFPLHQKFFVTFVLSALISMLLLYLVLKYGLHAQTRSERKSVRIKFLLMMINMFAFCLAIYFYMRHNWYCEPGMYTLFALAEYVVVVSNIFFHLTAAWDFTNQHIIVANS